MHGQLVSSHETRNQNTALLLLHAESFLSRVRVHNVVWLGKGPRLFVGMDVNVFHRMVGLEERNK